MYKTLKRLRDLLISPMLDNSSYIEWRIIREKLFKNEPYSNPLRLEKSGYKVYSQNDEDGIISEIFKRIGTTNKIFVEFGVGNGLENNTHFLLLKGWKGLWIEGDKKSCDYISKEFSKIIYNKDNEKNQLNLLNSFINKDNINKLISSVGITDEIDLLSIDIDGNDYHVFKEISCINPRVIIIEYNAKFPSDFSWVMEYDPNHIWDGSDQHGASLKALELLAREKGYQLVGTNISGINAFFVRSDLTGDLFYTPAMSENLYNPFFASYSTLFKPGHPPKHYLG